MTSAAFLSGRLPDGEANGLAAIVRQLVDDPEHIHVLVVLADCVKVTKLVESGATVPTIRIRRVEAISAGDDQAALQRILMRQYERRSGKPMLPLDLEDDVRAAFEDVDPDAPADPPDPPADPGDEPPRRQGKR